MEPLEISAFLHYGFLPQPPEGFTTRPWATDSGHPVCESSDAEAIERGIEAFREATPLEGERHVVPISGGLDSRLILARLLEAGLRDRIQAVTFGMPGSLDFEIGREVAKAAGVAHEAIDLREIPVDVETLEDGARNGGAWTPLFETIYNHLLPRRFGTNRVYWSGIMANTLVGSNLSPSDESWEEACRRFAAKNAFARSVRLSAPDFQPESVLPEGPLLARSNLGPYEQLHLGLRYGRRYEPSLLRSGVEYRTPFDTPAWVRFATTLTRSQRSGQRLYRTMARTVYPELFSLRTKANHGVPITAPRWRTELGRIGHKLNRLAWRHGLARRNRSLNYVDFENELREGGRLRETVYALTARLQERGSAPWVNIPKVWLEHDARKERHGDALTLLASLEVHLRLEKERTQPVESS